MNCGSYTCIVTFIGPVGVGKSTHIRLIRSHLRSKKVKVSTTFIKSSHALTHIVNVILMFLGAYKEVSYQERIIKICPRPAIFKRLLPLWCLLDTFSIATKFFFTVFVPFKLGFTVLIEEGLMMTFLTYRVVFPRFFGVKPRVPSLLPSLLGWVTRQNHVNVVLDATEKELVQRRKSRNYRQNELPEYVRMQKKWMRHLDSSDTIFIDTDGEPINVIHKKIVSVLERLMNERN